MPKTILTVCLLVVCAHAWAAPSSRSYGSGSFRSSPSYSRPSMSYSRPATSAAPRSVGTATGRTYTPSPQTTSGIRGTGTSTGRTYAPAVAPRASAPASVSRVYLSSRSYHPPFVNHYYYDSYGGGGMPWWGWLMLYNNHPTTVVAGNGASADYGTPVNWVGVFVWLTLLVGIGGGGLYYANRRGWL